MKFIFIIILIYRGTNPCQGIQKHLALLDYSNWLQR
jgi:hypothetical protein